jgi:uncharacterized protein YjiS (DUF1127 family)
MGLRTLAKTSNLHANRDELHCSKIYGATHTKSYIGDMVPASPEILTGEKDKIMLASIARLYQAWKRHESVKRELSHLTDRELADIGITRSDIDRIASQESHGA